MRISVLGATVVVVALVTACGTDGGGPLASGSDPSGTTASQEPTSATSTPTGAPTPGEPASGTGQQAEAPPAFPTGTARQLGKPSGRTDLVLSGVRVAQHEGFDRIVVELTGSGSPGWAVNYVDRPVLDGSGETVALAGDTFLDIYASGTTWSPDNLYSGPRRVGPESGGSLSEVYVVGTFEGDTQLLAGIDGGRVPFRVFTLTEPSRLVVDVVDRGSD